MPLLGLGNEWSYLSAVPLRVAANQLTSTYATMLFEICRRFVGVL